MIRYEDIKKPSSADRTKAVADETRRVLLKDIGAKWDRFSEADIAALKNADGLAKLLSAKYGCDEEQAVKDTTRFLKGRAF